MKTDEDIVAAAQIFIALNLHDFKMYQGMSRGLHVALQKEEFDELDTVEIFVGDVQFAMLTDELTASLN